MDSKEPTPSRASLSLPVGSIGDGLALLAWIVGAFFLVFMIASAAANPLLSVFSLLAALLILPPTYGLLRRLTRSRWLPIARVLGPALLVVGALVISNLEDRARLAAEEAQRQDPEWQRAQREAFEKEVELLKREAAARDIVAKKETALREKEAAEYAASPAGKICAAHPTWSREDCELLAAKKIWVGMRYEMVVYLLGKPDRANLSDYGSGSRYQYCWDGRSPSCFYDSNDDGVIDAYN